MKTPILAALSAAALCLPLHARTWTSSDGAKTFQGDLRSYDKDTGKVRVILHSGRTISFDKSKLSKEDIAYLAENAKTENAGAALEDQAVGAMVAKTKLYRLAGKKFHEATLEKTPDYYILYFTATW